MFKLNTETEVLDSFRSFERAEVEIPSDLHFPVRVKDYLAWTDSAGTKTFLVFSEGGKKLGVVFKKGSSGAISMCEWCHSVGEGSRIALLTAAATTQRRVGLHLCCDLSCGEKIRSVPGANDFPSSGSERERIRGVLQRMSRFARQNLF